MSNNWLAITKSHPVTVCYFITIWQNHCKQIGILKGWKLIYNSLDLYNNLTNFRHVHIYDRKIPLALLPSYFSYVQPTGSVLSSSVAALRLSSTLQFLPKTCHLPWRLVMCGVITFNASKLTKFQAVNILNRSCLVEFVHPHTHAHIFHLEQLHHLAYNWATLVTHV